MRLISQVIISSKIDETITALEAVRTTESIIKIVKEDSFLVEDVKKVMEKAYLTSEESTVIILASRRFSTIIQNRLLKILEEPPRNKEFIIITPNKSTIISTITSRIPLIVLKEETEEESLDLNLKELSLPLVYEFIQLHKRTDAKSMRRLIEKIFKEALYSQAYNMDEKTLKIFHNAYIALNIGSSAQFILNTILIKLLARKKR